MIPCAHWKAEGDGGVCAIGKYGGRPSLGTCRVCLNLPPAMMERPALRLRSVPLAVVEERRASCGRCEENSGDVCRRLLTIRPGCAAKVKVGTAIANASCPIGRWPAFKPREGKIDVPSTSEGAG